MAPSKEHQNTMQRCYQHALARLRNKYDEEFHEILEQLYRENNIEVKKRRPRSVVLQERISEAQRKLNERMDWESNDTPDI